MSRGTNVRGTTVRRTNVRWTNGTPPRTVYNSTDSIRHLAKYSKPKLLVPSLVKLKFPISLQPIKEDAQQKYVEFKSTNWQSTVRIVKFCSYSGEPCSCDQILIEAIFNSLLFWV